MSLSDEHKKLSKLGDQLLDRVDSYGPTLGNEKANMGKINENLYKHLVKMVVDNKNLDYRSDELKNKISKYVIDEDKKKDLYRQLGYLDLQAKDALKLVHGYMQKKIRLDRISQEYNMAGDDAIAKHMGNTARIRNLERERQDMMMEVAEYKNKMDSVFEKMNKMKIELRSKLHSYMQNTDKEKEPLGGKVVAVSLTALFGGTVLYYLSQLNPAQINTGAFTAGAGSPVVLMLATSAVIFFLFFATHHKLK